MNKFKSHHIISIIFLISWGIYSIIHLLSPFQSVYRTNYSLLYSWLFVLFTISVTFLSHTITSCNNYIFKSLDISNSTVVKLMIIIIFGVILGLYDKIVIQGFDYSTFDFNSIREKWLNNPRTTIVSSWYNALGHLLTFTCFALNWFVINVANNKISFKLKVIFINTLCITVSALSISSRSIMLLYFSHTFGCLLLFFLQQSVNRKSLLFVVSVSVVMFFYFYIYSSLTLSNRINDVAHIDKKSEMHEYFSGYYKELNVFAKTTSERYSSSTKLLLYLQNGYFNFEYTLYQKKHPGIISLTPMEIIYKKFNPDSKKKLQGLMEEV